MTNPKKTILVLLLVLAGGLAAMAQDAHAKFTLPHDAMWGKTALPAGRYSVSLEFGGITKAFVTSEAGSKLAFVAVPETSEVSDACDKTSVTLQRTGSNWSVRSVCFSELQMELYFPSEPTAVAALPSPPEPISGAR